MSCLRIAGDQWEVQIVTGLLSNICYARGNLQEALELARSAYRDSQRWNNQIGAARAVQAWAFAADGELPEHLVRFELDKDGTSLYRRFELLQAQAMQQAGQKRYLSAVQSAREGLAIGSCIPGFQAPIYPWIATWLREAYDLEQGDRDGLRTSMQQAGKQAVQKTRKFPLGRSHALREAAMIFARSGDIKRARKSFDESLALATELGQKRERALTLIARGELGTALGWAGAGTDLDTAAALMEKLDAPDLPALKVRFAALLDTARDLLANPAREATLLRTAEALRFMLQAEKAWVLGGNPTHPKALDGSSAPVCNDLYEQSLVEGRTVIASDPGGHPTLVRHGIRSAMCIPLGRKLVVYLIHRRIADLFQAEESRTLRFPRETHACRL